MRRGRKTPRERVGSQSDLGLSPGAVTCHLCDLSSMTYAFSYFLHLLKKSLLHKVKEIMHIKNLPQCPVQSRHSTNVTYFIMKGSCGIVDEKKKKMEEE